MDDNQQQALRKRQQISSTNKAMFIWVAVAAGITSIAIVVAISLFQRLVYNEKVLDKKGDTASTLRQNNQNAEKLKEAVMVRNTDDLLRSLKADPEDEPLQVVLDALPSTVNSAALGASLQSRKLLSANGVTLESLIVDPVSGFESGSSGEGSSSGSNSITFQFQISTGSSNAGKLKDTLDRLERSIRVMNIKEVSVEREGDRLKMTASGEAYYEPARNLDLRKEEVPL